jgi:hypothetical protein
MDPVASPDSSRFSTITQNIIHISTGFFHCQPKFFTCFKKAMVYVDKNEIW